LNTATVCPGADGFAEAEIAAAPGWLLTDAAGACADTELAATLGLEEPLPAGVAVWPQAANPSAPTLISQRKRRRVIRSQSMVML